jgi:hypothetical protein
VLVFELPLTELWKYDRWQNVEHPQLPSPDSVSLPESDLKSIEKYRGRKLRTLNRSDIVEIKRQISLNKEVMEKRAGELNQITDALEQELKIRKEQLELIHLYLGRGAAFVKIRSGVPAPESEKISVRQRVLYMDEEVGVIDGKELDFKTIRQFDKWISRPEHLAFIASELKCIVAFKPKRRDMHYSDDARENAFFNAPNHRTYLLFRNGDNVWRVLSGIRVGEKLFPEPETIDRLVKQKYEDQVEGRGSFKFDQGWSETYWEREYAEYKKKTQERERIKKELGVTDADFRETIEPMEYPTKADFLAAKQKWEEMLQNPEEHIDDKDKRAILERVYSEYKDELKDFMPALVLLQGIFDRMDIFGALIKGKINVFTGVGAKEFCNLIYDASETHLIEDKNIPSLEEWLISEAKKVKVFDYVYSTVNTTDHAAYVENYYHGQTIVGVVVKVLAPGKVIVKTLRKAGWYSLKEKVGNALHQIENGDESLHFFPFNLPEDQTNFYLKRRQDRSRYWNNLLVQLLEIKRLKAEGKLPEVSTVRWKERISDWSSERGE